MRLFGCYTGTSDWNPNGNDGTKNANWESAVRAFGKNVGRDANCVNVFPCWGSMQYWDQNLSGVVKGIATSGFGLALVPVVGLKMISANADGYAWNDVKGYNDVAAGKWDAMWRGCVKALASNGFKYSMIRIAYEYNGSFMQDFIGWDAATNTAWKNGFDHAASVMKDEAGKQGIRVDIVCNPNIMSSCPDVAGNLPKNFDILGIDIYNGFWGEGDVNNTDVRVAFWNAPKGGFGMQQAISLAKNLGKPIFIPECGSGPSANGVAHGIANDPAFWPFIGKSIAQMRSQGVAYWGMCVWDIQPSDGSWRFADGTQPQCLSDFKANVSLFVGDDVMGGGGTTTSAPIQSAPASSAATTLPIVSLGALSNDTLMLYMSEDAYQGDAQFTVVVDGKQVGGTQTCKALRAAKQSHPFTVLAAFGSGTHTVSINFLNDAWGGTAATDRNLYCDGATLNGALLPKSSLILLGTGPQSFTFTK